MEDGNASLETGLARLRRQEIALKRMEQIYESRNTALRSIVRFADTVSCLLLNESPGSEKQLDHDEEICGFDQAYLEFLPDPSAKLSAPDLAWKSPVAGTQGIDISNLDALLSTIRNRVCFQPRSKCTLHRQTHMPARSNLNVSTRSHPDLRSFTHIRSTKIVYPPPLWAHLHFHLNDLEVQDIRDRRMPRLETLLRDTHEELKWRRGRRGHVTVKTAGSVSVELDFTVVRDGASEQSRVHVSSRLHHCKDRES
jgi:hypothetical protein